MKKIAFIIGSLSGGGAQQVAVTLANELSEKNYSIDIVVLQLNDSKFRNWLSDKVNVINLDKNRLRYSIFSLFNCLLTNKYDLCVVFDYYLTFVISIFKLFNHHYIKIAARCINTLSIDFKYENIFLKYFKRIVVKLGYNLSDLIICQSNGMKFDLIDSFKISSNKIKVINNPLNKIIETNISYDFNPKEDYLFCIGRLEEQKNFELAIESFEKLKYKYPGLRLKIAGIGSFKEKLFEMANKLKIIDKIDFLGFISGDLLLNYYRKARLTLLTSLFEGFPNILIESLALGTPVVSINCPSGPSEIIINGVNGFLVDNYNSDDYAKAIIKGLEFDWDHKSLVNSVNRYRSEFIVKEYIRNIEEIIM